MGLSNITAKMTQNMCPDGSSSVCVCDFVVMVAGEVKRHVSEKDSEETVFRGQEGLLYR